MAFRFNQSIGSFGKKRFQVATGMRLEVSCFMHNFSCQSGNAQGYKVVFYKKE